MGTDTSPLARQMVDLLVVHAAELLICGGGRWTDGRGVRGAGLAALEVIADGAIAVAGDRVVAVGPTAEILAAYDGDRVVDATGKVVSPGLVDPHTHLVYAGSRHEEWEDRVLGRPVRDLDHGIRWTVERTRAASTEDLRRQAMGDLDEALAHGTTTLETKSGYGLDRDTELRLLQVAAGLEHPVDVVSTYLGAHVLPAEYAGRREEYVELVVDLLPEAVGLAEYCDVCVDPVGFTREECDRIAAAARRQGLGIRVHADQTGSAGGTAFAVEQRAASVDHFEYATDADLVALAASNTVAVLLPGVTHHMLEMVPGVHADGSPSVASAPPKAYLPTLVRRLVDLGACVALATDYNPGSCPSLSMQTAMQLAARLFRLGYAEIWHMATINAAIALDRGHDRGSLEVGKLADLVVWAVPEHGMIINRFGTNLVETVVKSGRIVIDRDPPHPASSTAAADSGSFGREDPR
jgi:imidazolonepropionase